MQLRNEKEENIMIIYLDEIYMLFGTTRTHCTCCTKESHVHILLGISNLQIYTYIHTLKILAQNRLEN